MPRCEPGAFPALSSGVGAAIALRFEGAAPQGDDVAKDSGNGHWRNRIIEYGTRPASQFQAHPRNWRKHPKAQREALAASLNGVGWVGVVLENARTGHLLDGHERLWQALEQGDETPVPYITVDLAEDEEHLVLATLDPIGAMAQTDAEMLEGILSELRETELVQEDGALDKLLNQIRNDTGLSEPGSDGSLLALADVSIGEPRHTVNRGDVWRVGNHLLICAQVLTGWPEWVGHLRGQGDVFAPYAGPFAPLSLKAAEVRLVMVQPDTYIAGHILDTYTSVYGEASVQRD